MVKDSEHFSKVIKTERNKPLIMTKKDHEGLKNSTKRWIYIKTYEEGKVKQWSCHRKIPMICALGV